MRTIDFGQAIAIKRSLGKIACEGGGGGKRKQEGEKNLWSVIHDFKQGLEARPLDSICIKALDAFSNDSQESRTRFCL